MSDIVYLMVSGQQQEAISDGCGTIASVGNRWQIGHEDEIFTFSLTNSITSTGAGSHLHGLRFCKLIDKSTQLFVNAINNNEQLYMEFYFYRINRFGKWEKYYYIQLRGAFISAIQYQFSENNLDTETITINYEYILCKHLIANTEFSYLALPENYNRLFIPPPKTPADNGLNTLNSKGVGRLLAAGGIYNGNIDGFRETAEKLGGDAIKGYDQVLNEKTTGALLAASSILLARRSSFDYYHEITIYLGKLRGEPKLLSGVIVKEINYTRRNPIEAALRKEFDSTIRKKFIIDLAKKPIYTNRFNSEDFLRMRNGNVPHNYSVHHKLPLDDGGTNSFDNLVLTKNEPYHKIFTNMQSNVTRKMLPGESKKILWAIPSGSIYPLK